MEIYAWVVTFPLCFRRFYMFTMPTHQKKTHGGLACNAAHLKVRHFFLISRCIRSVATPATNACTAKQHLKGCDLNASRRLRPRGCVMGYKKSPASFVSQVGRCSNLPKHATVYIYIDPTWETSSTLERFWFATVATAGGHRFRLFKGGILKRCFPLEDACFPHCGNPGASHQHPRFFSMLSMWVAPYNKPCDLTPWWWQKNGGTQAPRASFASSTRPLKRPKFQQLLQLSAVTSDRFIKHQEMEATFGYQRILTMLFIIIIIIPILGSTIPYIP